MKMYYKLYVFAILIKNTVVCSIFIRFLRIVVDDCILKQSETRPASL